MMMFDDDSSCTSVSDFEDDMEEEIFGFVNDANYQELQQQGEEEDNAYDDEEDDLGGGAFPVGRYKDVEPTKQKRRKKNHCRDYRL